MNVKITPATITRLARARDSPHATKPRLTRVELRTPGDVEIVLLAAHLLRGQNEVRIFPDVPWVERKKLNNLPKSEERSERNKSSVFIHGVPEGLGPNDVANYHHDCTEWRYIVEHLGINNVVTTEVIRIPSSSPNSRSDPRLLKVRMLTADMANACIQAWKSQRQKLPPEIRLQPPRSAFPKPDGVQSDAPVPLLHPISRN
jgi:hypothetical protein